MKKNCQENDFDFMKELQKIDLHAPLFPTKKDAYLQSLSGLGEIDHHFDNEDADIDFLSPDLITLPFADSGIEFNDENEEANKEISQVQSVQENSKKDQTKSTKILCKKKKTKKKKVTTNKKSTVGFNLLFNNFSQEKKNEQDFNHVVVKQERKNLNVLDVPQVESATEVIIKPFKSTVQYSALVFPPFVSEDSYYELKVVAKEKLLTLGVSNQDCGLLYYLKNGGPEKLNDGRFCFTFYLCFHTGVVDLVPKVYSTTFFITSGKPGQFKKRIFESNMFYIQKHTNQGENFFWANLNTNLITIKPNFPEMYDMMQMYDSIHQNMNTQHQYQGNFQPLQPLIKQENIDFYSKNPDNDLLIDDDSNTSISSF